jgi:hypothetical protein
MDANRTDLKLLRLVELLYATRSLTRRLGTEVLRDPAVSTLIFPPESKLHQPPR